MEAAGDATGAGQGGWVRRGGDPAAGAPQVPGLVMLRQLGAGGHGEVWLAEDLVSREKVAVKVRRSPADRADRSSGGADRPRDQAGQPPDRESEGAAQLRQEAALLRRIDHPNVVRLRRVVDLPDGARAMVMDHAAGGSLADLVGIRGPLDPGEASGTVVPLAGALADLHRRGLVHGDLTPSNVVFTAEGRPMIADLGCAVVLGDQPRQLWETPGYGDPARTGPPAPPDDVYALGALLRFALTGDPNPTADGVAQPGAFRRCPDPAADALLALADLSTAADPSRRPAPRAFAQTAFSAAAVTPVRLLTAGAPTPGVPVTGVPGAGAPVTRDRGGSTAPGTGKEAPGTGKEAPGTGKRSTGISKGTTETGKETTGAARPGGGPGGRWAGSVRIRKPPGVASPGAVTDPGPVTAATAMPAPTPVDLRMSERVTRQRPGRSPAPPEPSPRRRDLRGRGGGYRAGKRPPSGPLVGWAAAGGLALVVTVVAGWWWLAPGAGPSGSVSPSAAGVAGRGTSAAGAAADSVPTAADPGFGLPAGGGPGSAPTTSPAASQAASQVTASQVGVPDPGDTGTAKAGTEASGREPPQDAVVRLASARAAAFQAASTDQLVDVDEPGSWALAADVAFVQRLRAAGVRLEGLSFEVAGQRVVQNPDGTARVGAQVTTSAYRQVGASWSTPVARGQPRSVSLTLVPTADGRGWLVRSVG